VSHHYSGPEWGFPRGDARLDLTDLYAFPKPGDAGKSIVIMNVHPSVRDYLDRERPLAPTTSDPFAPEALYELKIDTDGDTVADVAYRVRFSSFEGGTQTATLRRVDGAQAAETGDGGQVVVEGAPVSTGREAQVTEAGDYRFFAGWRSDPFFFDRRGAVNNLQFTGDDFFADKDVCSIVLEIPNSALGPNKVSVWHRTLIPADDAGGVGYRWSVALGLCNSSSSSASPARRGMPISQGTRRTISASLPPSRMRWNTRADTRQRKRSGWLGRCCRRSSPMTPRAQPPFRTMDEHLRTTRPTCSWLLSQMGW
jgi:Domain of unknown function (DUF4331)